MTNSSCNCTHFMYVVKERTKSSLSLVILKTKFQANKSG